MKLTFIESNLNSEEHFNACVQLTQENHVFNSRLGGRGRVQSISQTEKDTQEIMKAGLVRVFFIKDGDNYVGLLTATIENTPKRLTWVLDLFLRKEYRRMGAAKKLMNLMFTWAKKKGSTTAYVRAVIKNKGAVSFYQQEGFEPDTIVLRAKL